MKKAFFLFLAAGILLTQGACKKNTEDVVDCIVESLFTSISHTTDPVDSKKIYFVANYGGTHTVKSVTWNYGDGSPAVVGGINASHTYSSAGPYKVKAAILIVSGSSTCTPEPEKDITVN